MRKARWLALLTAVLVIGLGLFTRRRFEGGVCLPLPDLTEFMFASPSLALPYPTPPAPEVWQALSADQRLQSIQTRVAPQLRSELAKQGLRWGAPVYLRGFKESRELELWLQNDSAWQLWRRYPIAAASGVLGPKQAEGDRQVPEGCYGITAARLNPASQYHLAMNIGYPNAWDRHRQRTGSFIMIHGRAVSVGCLAMTDPVIEEIYLLVSTALAAGQTEVPVHLFPFRMTEARLAARGDHPAVPLWRELKPIHDHFETSQQLPQVRCTAGAYELIPPLTTQPETGF